MSALWKADAPVILASGSAIRRTMLDAAGIPVQVRPGNIDERTLEQRHGAATAASIAGLLAMEKARVVSATYPGRLVLGADQMLALGETRFSKPTSRDAARDQLRTLRRQTHALHSAAAVVRDGAVLFAHVESAHLTMRDFSDDFLDRYLDEVGEAVMTSVGAYQLEGRGVHLFEKIDGDHFTILGLPLLALLSFFRREGFLHS